MLYTYQAYISSVYDGDTVTADIDLGFGIVKHGEKIRLFGINAPEVRGENREVGILSRDWLSENILNKQIILKTIKDKGGKYGRLLGKIYLDGVSINDQLVELGYAIKADY